LAAAIVGLTAALAAGCHGEVGGVSGKAGAGNIVGTGGITGTGGAGNSGPAVPCAVRRTPGWWSHHNGIVRLTMTETYNTVRYLINATEADALKTAGLITGDRRHDQPAVSAPAADDHHRRRIQDPGQHRPARLDLRPHQLRDAGRVHDRHRQLRDDVSEQVRGAGRTGAS
jgi:hypothetical protein